MSEPSKKDIALATEWAGMIGSCTLRNSLERDFAAVRAEGAAEERRKIVVWLRAGGEAAWGMAEAYADAIESGEQE